MAGVMHVTKPIIISRLEVVEAVNACGVPGAISLSTNNLNTTLYTLSLLWTGYYFGVDSGPLSIPVAANSEVALWVSTGPVCGINEGPANVPVAMEYVMQ